MCRDSVRLKSRSRLPNYVRMMHFDLCKKMKKRAAGAVELTAEAVLECWHRQKGMCALSGVPMTHHNSTAGAPPPPGPPPFVPPGGDTTAVASYTQTNVCVDRVDGTGPFTKDNLQLVCAFVCPSKRDLDNRTFRHLCALCGGGPRREGGGGAADHAAARST